jgi:hypothetical protein
MDVEQPGWVDLKTGVKACDPESVHDLCHHEKGGPDLAFEQQNKLVDYLGLGGIFGVVLRGNFWGRRGVPKNLEFEVCHWPLDIFF